MPELIDALARVAPLRERRLEDFKVKPLPGYTNHNYRLRSDAEDWVLRIPKTSTGAYIDRAAEAHNQAQASRLQLAPGVAWRDDTGLCLTPTLPGRSLRPDDLFDSRTRATVAAALRRLHRSGLEFHGRVDLAELIPRYFRLTPPAVQRRLSPRLQQAEQSLHWLEDNDLPAVASHNDLILENLLLDPNRLWIIDWEFSAMASPYWDLATLCNAAALTRPQAGELMRDYCARTLQMEESALCAYRDLLQLLSDCWMAALVPEAT